MLDSDRVIRAIQRLIEERDGPEAAGPDNDQRLTHWCLMARVAATSSSSRRLGPPPGAERLRLPGHVTRVLLPALEPVDTNITSEFRGIGLLIATIATIG
jgi:hypothetical protein